MTALTVFTALDITLSFCSFFFKNAGQRGDREGFDGLGGVGGCGGFGRDLYPLEFNPPFPTA